jgi:hypothetical protein
MKDIVTEETTSNEPIPNLVGVSVTGCYEGIENDRTE